MSAFPIRTAVLTLAATIGLSACMSPYGYGGVGVGYGGGYGGYGSGYGYPGYGYGYEPYWGWHDGYYYPGNGYYVYDRYRRPYRWTDRHRDYWERRRENAMSSSEFRRQMEARRDQLDQPNWSGFNQAPTRVQRIRSNDDRPARIERDRSRSERSSTRSSRGESRRQSPSDFRRAQEQDSDD